MPVILLCSANILCRAEEIKKPEKAETEAYLANWDANMKRVSVALDKYRGLAETGTVEAVIAVLDKERTKSNNQIQWKSLPIVDFAEVNALRKKWFANHARSFMADNAVYVKNEALYISHEGSRILFGSLLTRDPECALQWLAEAKDHENPTLFDAIMCGETCLHEDGKALFSAEAGAHWKTMLTAKNPALVALALQMHQDREMAEDDLSSAITSALQNEWISLQDIALDASKKLKPDHAKLLIKQYLKRSPNTRKPTEHLRQKAQKILTELSSVE